MVKDDVKMLRDGGNYLFIYLFIYIRQWGYIKKMLMDDIEKKDFR
jgi:hypothetical protein